MLDREIKNKNYLQDAKSFSANSTSFSEVREKALKDLEELGLPHNKLEDWKYTNLFKYLPNHLTHSNYEKNGMPQENLLAEISTETHLSFVNGFLDQGLSKIGNNISLTALSKLDKKSNEYNQYLKLNNTEKETINSINTLICPEIYILEIPEKSEIKNPIIISYHNLKNDGPTYAAPRIIIDAKKNSRSSMIELFTSDLDSNIVTNSSLKIFVRENAHLNQLKINNEAKTNTLLTQNTIDLYRSSHYTHTSFSTTGDVSRHNSTVNLIEDGAEVFLNGIFAIREKTHCDHFVTVNHLAPHTYSHQLFKGILDDQSRGAFTGKVVVHRDAQQVDSSQLNKNILLSNSAHMDTRPQLEVYADDVKCAHGATVGQLSEEEIFYLESRGIKKEQAQNILCHAFANEVIQKFPNEEVQKVLTNLFYENFEKYALEKK